MADALEVSFTLEELEESLIEEVAALPNVDNLTTCKCRGHCLRESGRNFCPCRSLNNFCSRACHGEDFGVCMNNRRTQESDSEKTDSDFSLQEESQDESEGERGRGRGRGRARGRGRGRPRGQGRGARGQGRGTRGQGRGARGQRGARRGRGRGRGRGQLVEELDAAENQANHEQQLINVVEALNVGTLRRLALELLRRQPAAFADLVNGEMAGGDGVQQPNIQPQPDNNLLEWCNCGHCIAMPIQEENRCCIQTKRPCISRTALFQQLILNGNVLDIAMRYREDVLVLNNVRNNENFRHAAYRQYVLWQHGRLGRGNRRVVPSCCVVAIRTRYPSPNGLYTGYRPARL